MPRRPQPLRVAIDTGGTFTDCVWIDDANRLRMLKVFSTPADPSQSHRRSSPQNQSRRRVRHPARHHSRYQHSARTQGRPHRPGDDRWLRRRHRNRTPGPPQALRFFLRPHRTAGPERSPLRHRRTHRQRWRNPHLALARRPERASLSNSKAKHPASIAISLLFSFANPKNEQGIAEALKPLGVPLSISHQILPEFREYERTSTVVINAYLQPVMQRYLENLEHSARETWWTSGD